MKRFRIQSSKKLPSRRYMSIKASEEFDDDEYELNQAEQEYDSAATSINSNKLPAIYKLISLPQGSVCVDFGGGRFDNAVEYIKDMGATLCVYDPYNRSAEHNKEVLKTLKANGGADAAINSNVLNVIKEPEARKAVLENIAKITKAGAPIYITVYEGTGKGNEGPTKSGYQLNRKTQDYLEEIQEVFPDAKRKGKLITAHNNSGITSSINASSAVTSSIWMAKYKDIEKQMHKICFEFDGDYDEAEEEADGIIPEPYCYLKVLGKINSRESAERDGFKFIESATNTCNMGAAVKGNEFVSQYAGEPSSNLKVGEEVYWIENGEVWRDKVGVIDKIYELLSTEHARNYTVYDVRWGNSDESIGVDSWNLVRVSDADQEEVFESTSINAATSYTDYEKIKSPQTRQEYGYHYSCDDTDDAQELFRSYKGQISSIHPYDDAKYTWARFANGTVEYIRDGKVVDESYYDGPDDDINLQDEWCSDLVDTIMISLDDMNSDVEPKMIHMSTDVKASLDDTMQELHSELMARLKEVMTSPEMGFDEKQSDDKYDAYWQDYCTIDIDQDDEYYKVEVRAEVSYEGMETIKEKLDPTIAGYDSDAYLDFDEPGIMSAWINKAKAAASLQEVESATNAKNTPFSKSYNGYRIRLLNDGTGYAVFDPHGEMEEAGFKTVDNAKQFVDSLAQEAPVETSEHIEAAWYDVPDHDLDPPEYDEPEYEDTQETVEIEFDELIHMDNQGSWTYDDESYAFAEPWDTKGHWWKSEDGVTLDDSVSMVEHIDDLIETLLPASAGDYQISGIANLVFDIELCKYLIHDDWEKETYDEVDADESNASFNLDASSIDNFKCKKIR